MIFLSDFISFQSVSLVSSIDQVPVFGIDFELLSDFFLTGNPVVYFSSYRKRDLFISSFPWLIEWETRERDWDSLFLLLFLICIFCPSHISRVRKKLLIRILVGISIDHLLSSIAFYSLSLSIQREPRTHSSLEFPESVVGRPLETL